MPTFIGICGGSSSGKTTISNYLFNYIKNTTQISLDNYTCVKQNGNYKSREEYIKNTNFDCPEAYNIDLFLYHLKELRGGREIKMPIYDFKTSTYTGFKIIKPQKYILLDGILLFSNIEILKQLDLCIFVHCNDIIRDKRRIHRDTNERGATTETVTHQLISTVNPMYYKYVFPNRYAADIVFNNSEDVEDNILHENLSELYKKVVKYLENTESKSMDIV